MFDWFLILLVFAIVVAAVPFTPPSPTPSFIHDRTHMHARRHTHAHITLNTNDRYSPEAPLSKSTRNSYCAMNNINLKTIIPSMETNMYINVYGHCFVWPARARLSA